jgi:hypothetical protein
MTREQCKAAIEKPARVFGGMVEPALVNRLLNEMSSDPNQLPLLQHCLMRMWTKATSIEQGGEIHEKIQTRITRRPAVQR